MKKSKDGCGTWFLMLLVMGIIAVLSNKPTEGMANHEPTLPQGVYAGTYGRHNGWGSIGKAANTPEEVVALVAQQAYKVSVNMIGVGITPVIYLNVHGAGTGDERPDVINQYLAAAGAQGVIVSLDIQPTNWDVASLCRAYSPYATQKVWFSLDFENLKGISSVAVNECAQIFNNAYAQTGSGGILGIWEFGSGTVSDPQNIQKSWSNLTIVPLFDGIGSPDAKAAMFEAMLNRYSSPMGGFMEWLSLYPDGRYDHSIPGNPTEYWLERLAGKILIFLRF